MQALLDVILPVFLVLGFGYIAVWRQIISDAGVDGLMTFTQSFALPCLLFQAISSLDLSLFLNWGLLLSYYASAIACYVVGIIGARVLFKRPWEDSIAIGFCCLFSNTLMLGLPITERAYGPDALEANFALIALNAPLCYGIGITTMEIVRNTGHGLLSTTSKVLSAIFRNALVIAICLGFVVNLLSVPIPSVVASALTMIVAAALPAALFGLGGVLYRYRPEGDLRTIMFVVAVSLLLHPALVWGFGTAADLSTDGFRSAIITAAVAPGANVYIFANMYGVAKRVAASSVLLGTIGSIVTVWFWLSVLP
jgi:predicted permease